MNKESRILQLLGVSNQTASHIPLKQGIVKVNPHLQVLCPKLAKGEECRKGYKNIKGFYKRPQLLIKHHSNPNLQLWHCEGCPQFLLRVQKF